MTQTPTTPNPDASARPWTKGPWAIGGMYGSDALEIVGANGDRLIGKVLTHTCLERNVFVEKSEGLANARLAAAAPSLFEALAGWEKLHEDMVAAGGNLGCLPDGLIDQFGRTQIALMDATTAALALALAQAPARGDEG